MSDLDQIVDQFGNIRRMGSLPLPEDYVPTFATFESAFPVWDDADIRMALLHPDRRIMRQVFDSYWKVDQHSVGSCNGWAAAGGLAKTRWLRGIQDRMKFSGAYLYSLMNGGSDNGSNLSAGMRLLEEKGCCPFEMVAWNKIYPRLYNKTLADHAASMHKGLSCYRLNTLQELRTAGAFGYMCIVAVQAGNNFMRLNSAGISGVDNGRGNHSILIQDLRLINGTEVFDHDGSWGLSYGQNGNSYLVAEHFAQTIKTHQFYAITSTAEADNQEALGHRR